MNDKKRVLLVCTNRLLGESIEVLLRRSGNIRLIGPWDYTLEALQQLSSAHPDAVVIAEEYDDTSEVASVVSRILDLCLDVPVILMNLEQCQLRVVSSHTLPANYASLMDVITHSGDNESKDS